MNDMTHNFAPRWEEALLRAAPREETRDFTCICVPSRADFFIGPTEVTPTYLELILLATLTVGYDA